MSSTIKPINPEIRKQVIERVKKGDTSIPDIAKEHGISTHTIYRWTGKSVEAPPTILELAKLKKENQMLKELLGAITMELSIEKKKTVGA